MLFRALNFWSIMNTTESTGHWVMDFRPNTLKDMVIPEKLGHAIRKLESQNASKKILIVGSAGTGKTLLAEHLSGKDLSSIDLKDEGFFSCMQNALSNHQNHTLILKHLESTNSNPVELASLLSKCPHQIILTSRNFDFSEPFVGEGFELVEMEPLLPPDENSFMVTKEHILKLLKKNKISFSPVDREFILNTRELFDKLWPNQRQIIRQTQMRCKTGNWVSTPV